jgi:hypothetical protein
MTDNQMLYSAIAALASVIGFLWKQITNHYAEMKQSRDDCEADREKLHGEMKTLWRAVYQVHPAAVAMRVPKPGEIEGEEN